MAAFSPSLPNSVAPPLLPVAAEFSAKGPLVQGQVAAPGVAADAKRENLWALGVVGAIHLALLGWLTHSLNQRPAPVLPTSVVGMLVLAQPVVPPMPLPMVEQPKPVPRQVVRPQAVAPLPVAAPSERAVTAPQPEATTPSTAEPVLAAAPVPPAPTPAPVAAPEPVVPPRSDAAHLNNPAPTYPPVSRRLGEQGRVQLDVYILADGSVGEIKLKRSSGYPRLDQAALDAVRQWRYQPARRGSDAIPFWYVQPMSFSLDG